MPDLPAAALARPHGDLTNVRKLDGKGRHEEH